MATTMKIWAPFVPNENHAFSGSTVTHPEPLQEYFSSRDTGIAVGQLLHLYCATENLVARRRNLPLFWYIMVFSIMIAENTSDLEWPQMTFMNLPDLIDILYSRYTFWRWLMALSISWKFHDDRPKTVATVTSQAFKEAQSLDLRWPWDNFIHKLCVIDSWYGIKNCAFFRYTWNSNEGELAPRDMFCRLH